MTTTSKKYHFVKLTDQQAADMLDAARTLAKSDETLGCFSTGNSKLNHLADAYGIPKSWVGAFDGLAGETCPFANICYGKAVELEDGSMTIWQHPDAPINCFARDIEARRKVVYLAHKRNTDGIKSFGKDSIGMAIWIMATILRYSPRIDRGGIVRWHASGDFFRAAYVVAADMVAQCMPEVTFFGYSKSPWVVAELTNSPTQNNTWMVHSHGSKFDHIAAEMGLPQCYIEEYPGQWGDVPVVCATPDTPDDFERIVAQESFTIPIH